MYKYELHMHTREGSACARKSVVQMIKHYHELGFSGAVVTNHFIGGNTSVDRSLYWEDFVNEFSRGYFDGQKTARELDFDLLFGLEQGYGEGREFLVYGITPEFLLTRPFLRNAGADVWSSEVRKVGGVIIAAHPFRNRPYIKNPDKAPDMTLFDGVEGYNFCNKPEENEKAAAVFSKMDTLIIAGNDFHDDNFKDCFATAFEKRAKTEKELAKMLIENNFELVL